MTGFFKSISKHKVSSPLKGMKTETGCYECGLYKKCNSPQMPVSGKGRSKILIIGEAPGENEDNKNKQFVGKSGDYLRKILYNHRCDLDIDCWKINSINCRPTDKKGQNRKPTAREINCCRHKWKQVVKDLKPEKIILLGLVAVQSFLGDRTNNIGTMEKWTGWQIPDQDYRTWVFPTYHPSYLIRNSKNKILHKFFDQHLETAITHNKPFKKHKQILNLLKDEEKIYAYLDSLIKYPPNKLAFDFETSGLKPHAEWHFIRTMAISADPYSATAFPYLNDKKFINKIRSILTGPSKKIMHNMAYEIIWANEIIGSEVNKPAFDTMLASHVLDNRSGITSLKFQTYINYGVIGYESEVKKFLESNKKSGNAKNKIEKAPLKQTMEYNAQDSMFTLRLSIDQEKKLTKENLDEAYDLLHDGAISCINASKEGIHIDEDYFEDLKNELTDKLVDIENEIRKSKEHKKWIENKSKNNNLNILSTHQVKDLIIKVLKLKTDKTTKKGNISVDEEVLEKLSKKHKFFKLILEYKKLHKIKETYIQGLTREAINGIIHPNINLHLARTYRSSVDGPNLQNIPKRDKEMKKLIRLGIKPKPGYKLMAVDYSGAEIRSGCVYHGDKQMIAYQIEKKGDMHKEYAAKIYQLPLKEVNDDIKYEGKNGFVFPQFYGDYWGNNSKQLWPASLRLKRSDGESLRNHLRNKGILNLNKFEKHLQEIECEFWEETFSEFNDWKEEAWKDYNELGYIKMLTGFKCGGLLSRKHVVNYPFQGTAFHWLLWAMVEVDHYLRKEGLKSRIIMQIHDELLLNVHPKEEKQVYKIIKKIMTEDILDHWEWINIPLEVEAKISEVDGNWYKMKKIA